MDEIVISEEKGLPIPEKAKLVEQFNSAFALVDDIVMKNYISRLNEMEIIPLDERVCQQSLNDNVRFFKITEMVYEKDEYATYKLASVFNSLSTASCAAFILIDSNGEKTDFYMGVRSLDDERTTNSIKETLKNAMYGQFPGIKTTDYLEEGMQEVVSHIKTNNITVVTCVANNKDKDNNSNAAFIQGLEKLALSMQGKRYTALILANSTGKNQLADIRRSYENIYTNLAPFANGQISYATNNSVSVSDALNMTQAFGKSHTTNISLTHGVTETSGTSISDSYTRENRLSNVAKLGGTILGGLGVVATIVTSGLAIPLLVAAGAAQGVSILTQGSETHGDSSSESTGTSESKAEGSADTASETKTKGETTTKGMQTGNSVNMTMNLTNKAIMSILERLDMQLKRLEEFESLGMWECAAYFMSDSPYAAEIAASTYKALMRGENSGVEASAINSWSKSTDSVKITEMQKYITNFIHPMFLYKKEMVSLPVTACSLISGNEVALHMGLPRKSVCGFPVVEHADFGKEIVAYNNSGTKNTINLGKIFNMGSECPNRVELDMELLSMHTFITGSTGSGKSNTIYELLRQLSNAGIKFMVVEPAKGEYKNVFGHQRNVTVLGTNPQYGELLRINPFKFPSSIHLFEHVDRLIEIFNVCWPMYAAMPAVLKDAILQAYEVCGWDLVNSKNKYSNNLFPTFSDLQNEIIDVIEKSAYALELKSNYIGSLATRVKSLTNGLNGQIFSANEIDNKLLFDENVIVDLSRIGSLETKSLIMGILVMRLNEYRMANANGMNLPLSHVTVLEEAHNILKRTSTEQNPENPSVSAKSVEMLSNAIAEMRTYGEGFIIADQSPNAVDLSAIRNTNTKIILRLPDEADRRLVGKSAALKDEQLDEIAKLPNGVAVIYQNDWLEAILCKIKKFNGKENYNPLNKKEKPAEVRNYNFISEIIKMLLKKRVASKVVFDVGKIEEFLDSASISTKSKIGIRCLLEEFKNTGSLKLWNDAEAFPQIAEAVTELLGCKAQLISLLSRSQNNECLKNDLKKIIEESVGSLPDDVMLEVAHCLMRNTVKNCNPNDIEIYSAWKKYNEGDEI